MPIPGQNLTVRDPGLGLVPDVVATPLLLGTSEKGTVNTLVSYSTKQDVVDTLGEGPLSEDLCHVLDVAGGPVLGMRLTGSVAGAAGAVTPTRVGTSTGTVTVGNAPFDAYEVVIEIMATGDLGVGTFRYSLDDGRTYSETLTIPSGGIYNVPRTNLQLTFVSGAGPVFFEDGDLHEFDCTAPYYSTTDLANAVTALLAAPTAFAFIHLGGKPADATGGNTMAAALDTHLVSLFNQFRYVRAIMDVGDDTTANVITNFTNASTRICPAYGDEDVASAKPFAGWGTPKRSASLSVAARAAASLISTDLGRFASGALTGVVAISHDEFRNEVLDQQKFTTLRTWQGFSGFFITNARFHSVAGSDFLFWQHGRVMDVACDTVYKVQQEFVGTGIRTNADGTIHELDAQRIEKRVRNALIANLLDPSNAEGTKGHVSALDYKVNRQNDVLGTNEIIGSVAVQPLAYAKTLTADIGFARLGG